MGKRFIIILLILFIFGACKEKYTPRPRGYFRISFPEKKYTEFQEKGFPYVFEIPTYAEINNLSKNNQDKFDVTVVIPENKADIHITYKQISKDSEIGKLEFLLEDSRTLAYKHTIKADAIEERIFINPIEKVYGTIYLIEGNAASPMQFFLTDSTTHFLRGSFYIRDIPNIDSLKPVIDFIEPDIIHLIETTKWE
ncbi:MAG: gliding motility lipoprotein GldD [Prolixibacteraceae bacterium]|nr:gliding motility lipoprotein GldD [Prolixibacteraceae bacterium]MBN2772763.1 gliding motility lipoprotein GldD [Prolixibacteraceae bacterium]